MVFSSNFLQLQKQKLDLISLSTPISSFDEKSKSKAESQPLGFDMVQRVLTWGKIVWRSGLHFIE